MKFSCFVIINGQILNTKWEIRHIKEGADSETEVTFLTTRQNKANTKNLSKYSDGKYYTVIDAETNLAAIKLPQNVFFCGTI